MMLNLLSSIERIIIAVLLIAVAFVAYTANNIKLELTAANKEIEAHETALENAAIKNEYLQQSVNLSEQANAKLLKERDSLSKITAQYESSIKELSVKFASAKNEINELRSSHDETTNVWANDTVPCDAVRLLKYAKSCDRNSYSDSIRLRGTAFGIGGTLRSKAVVSYR